MRKPKTPRYTLVKGQISIRNSVNPRQGPQPDGDTVTFFPDSIDLVKRLRRLSGTAPNIRNGHINVRYEGIDALETHVQGAHQNLTFAKAARDRNLELLGFKNVVFFPDLPNVVESVDKNPLSGYVMANGIESNGRLLGLVFLGTTKRKDGEQVFVDEEILDRSVNARLVSDGLVYVEPYDSMPIALIQILRKRVAKARKSAVGLWPDEDVTTENAIRIANLADAQTLVMWPKLFRRLVAYFQASNTGLDQFDDWIRDDPARRDDTLRLPNGEKANMHDTYLIDGDTLRLNYRPEDLLIAPDPNPIPL
jgi:endonuclease YncB( thermonuclease family)